MRQTDTTGAGDAFGSGLVAGYIISGDFEIALKFGILNSGGEVAEYGAESGIMTREEIESKLQGVEIEKIK
jgi:sugar/nucleoside kinase (ribokinase family)